MCETTLSFKSTISNLKNHIKKKHPTINLDTNTNSVNQRSAVPVLTESPTPSTSTSIPVIENPVPEQTFRNVPPLLSPPPRQSQLGTFIRKNITPVQKRKIDRCLLRLFTRDFQPFTVVEDEGFKNFVQELNPNYSLPNRRTISSSWIPAAYEECKRNVLNKLKNIKKVCLTTDCWSSSAQDSYLALTAHFIDIEYKFQSVLLDCCRIEGSHTATNLAANIKEITERFSLSDKILVVISDNDSKIVKAVKSELKWPHFGCYAHTLNLIVQHALDNSGVAVVIEKMKTIVKHFKRSNQDLEKLLKYQKDSGVEQPLKLVLDVATRWNSTFYMVQRAVLLQDAVKATLALINKDIPALTFQEWQIAADLCKVRDTLFLGGLSIIIFKTELKNYLICNIFYSVDKFLKFSLAT